MDIATLNILVKARDEASAVLGKVGSAASGAMKIAGAAALAGGGAIAAGLAVGVKGAADLQQQVANISTIKPDIDTSAVFRSLNEMQTRVPQSAAQLGDALYNVFSSMDVSVAGGMQLVETFAKGATGAATDAQTFGTAVMGVMNAYGLSVDQAEHVTDVFFNTVNKGVVTGPELAASLGPVTQSAKAAGVSLDQLGGMIAGVTKEGGPASQNINNLNNFLSKVTTKEAQAQIHALGIKTVDATGHFRPMTDLLSDLKGKLGGMTEAARNNAIQAIFPDAQARQGAMTLMSQLDAVNDAINANKNQTGAAADAYKKMSETAASQWALAKNSVMSVLTTMGAQVLPLITPLLTTFSQHLPGAFQLAQDKGSQFAGYFRDNLLPPLQEVGAFLRDVIAPALRDFIGEDVLPKVQSFGELLKGAFDKAAPVVADVAGAVSNVLGPAIERVVGFIAEHKEILAALFPAGVILAIIKNWDDLTARVPVLGQVFDAVQSTVETALGAVRDLIGNVADWVQGHWGQITDIAGQVWQGVVDVVTTVIESVREQVERVIDIVRANWDRISDAAGRAWSMVTDIVGAVVDAVKELISGMVEWWRANWDNIRGATETILKVIAGIVAAAVVAIAYAWDLLGDPIISVVTVAFNGAKAIIQSVLQIIGGIISAALALLSGDWKGAWDGLKTAVEGAWNLIKAAVDTGIGLVVAVVKGLGSAILTAVGDLGRLLYNVGTRVIQGFIDGIESMFGAVKDKLGELTGKLTSWKGPESVDKTLLTQSGKWIIEGLITGFDAMLPAVKEALTAITTVTQQSVTPSVSLLASGMAGATTAIDDYRQGLYGAREQLQDVNQRLLDLHRALLNTKPHTAQRDAINAQIQALTQERNEIQAAVRGYEELTATAVKGISALDGFSDAVNRVSADAKNVAQFGQLGVAAIDALSTALLEDSPKAGAAAVKAATAAAEAARRAGVPNWQELAAAQLAAYGTALSERTPEAIQAALDATEAINRAVAARGAFNAENVQSAIDAAHSTRMNTTDLGGLAGGFGALQQVIAEGGQVNLAAIGKFVDDARAALGKLPQSVQDQLGPAYEAALAAFIASPSAETLAAVRQATQDVVTANAIIPKNFSSLLPEVQAYITGLVTSVQAGALDLETAQRQAADAAKIVPSGFRQMLPEVQAYVVDLVNKVRDGSLSIEDAARLAGEAGKLIPTGFRQMVPEVQAYVLDLVSKVRDGSLSLEEATRLAGDAAKLIPSGFKEAAPQVRDIILGIVAQVRAGAISIEEGTRLAGQAAKLIPDGFKDAAPQIQAIITDIVAKVRAGQISIADASKLTGQAIGLIPSSYRRAIPEVKAAIDGIVAQVQAGTLGMQEAIDRIDDVTKLIPQNLHELRPQVQEAIMGIVNEYVRGAIGIEEAVRRVQRAQSAIAAKVGTPSTALEDWISQGGTYANYTVGATNPPKPKPHGDGGILMDTLFAIDRRGGAHLMGERGPGTEALVPLDRLGMAGGGRTEVHYHQHAPNYGVLDMRREIISVIREAIQNGAFSGVIATP